MIEKLITLSIVLPVITDSKGRVCCQVMINHAPDDSEFCELDGCGEPMSCGVNTGLQMDEETRSVPAPLECPIIKQIQFNDRCDRHLQEETRNDFQSEIKNNPILQWISNNKELAESLRDKWVAIDPDNNLFANSKSLQGILDAVPLSAHCKIAYLEKTLLGFPLSKV